MNANTIDNSSNNFPIWVQQVPSEILNSDKAKDENSSGAATQGDKESPANKNNDAQYSEIDPEVNKNVS